jgi:hypothetical protein
MSNTKREPLLSNADLGYVKDTHTPEQVRDTYESARAKDAELIQMLVDSLANMRDIHEFRVGREPLTGMDELKAAEDAGFKPSEQ